MASLSKKKILKNTTASPIELTQVGVTVPALGQIIIEPGQYFLYANEIGLSPPGQLDTLISSGAIVVNDGVLDLKSSNGISEDRAIDYLKHPDTAFNIRFLSQPERSNGFTSKTVQEAIEEAKNNSDSISRWAASCGFDGSATTGRYLEYNANVDSNQAGLIITRSCKLRELGLVCLSNTTTTMQVLKWNGVAETLLTTISLAAARKVSITGLNIDLIALDELRVKVTSGTSSRPILWQYFQNI